MLSTLTLGFETGMGDPLLQKSPRGGKACASPLSQISTAPGTPCFLLLDPEVPEMPSVKDRFGSDWSIPEVDSAEEASPGLVPVNQWYPPEPMLTSHLGEWAKARVESAIPEPQLNSHLGLWAQGFVESHIPQPNLNSSLAKWAQFTVEDLNCGMQLPEPELKSSLGRRMKNQVEELTFELPEPNLNSQLGQWAQRHVEETPLCIGMPPLQSEIGQRAQRMVEAEKWLEEQMKILADQEQYIVDNRGLHEGTDRLAYRKSKIVEDHEENIEGPMWGTKIVGVDEGDGWLKVGNLYLPMALEGMQVLTPTLQSRLDVGVDSEPMRDGPALTQDGHVVDLEGGLPIFFVSDKVCSTGHSCKVVMLKAAKHANHTKSMLDVETAALEVDEQAVCSLDLDGVLYGAKSFSWRPASVAKETSKAAKDRLKLFHQKRKERQHGQAAASDEVLGVEANGQVSLFVYNNLPSRADKLKKKRRCQEQQSVQSAGETVFVIDANGAVQDW